jgi:molybdate transport system ATP-binding protein
MSLAVDIRHQRGEFRLDARFASAAPVTALFGPSGSGKTTIIRVIAGLLKPSHCKISVGGDVLADTDAGLFPPPHARRIGYVSQEALLFPHLDVRKNLNFGNWFTPRARRGASFDQIVAMLGIGHLLSRRPHTLSGGERQRVAIGRALLASPALLLLDEPLAALDEARKAEIMPYLEALRDDGGVPMVYVSHSRPEVGRLAGDIVIMEEGKVVASGAAAQIFGKALHA